MSAPGGWKADVRMALLCDPRRYADHLWGSKSVRVGPDERRWSGSHCVVISGRNKGAWKCWTAGVPGGGLIEATAFHFGVDKVGAWRIAAEYYGICIDRKRTEFTPEERRRRREQQRARAAEAERIEAKRLAERAGKAQRIWARTVPLAGTLGEQHLVEVRRIPRPAEGWPDAIAWHPGLNAIIANVTESAGELRAVHSIYLDRQGRNFVNASTGKKQKLTFGPRHGCAVRLPAKKSGEAAGFSCGPALLQRAEGLETALSGWMATGYETWALLGPLSEADPPPGRRVIDLRDDDPTESKIEIAYQRALDGWKARGHKIAIALPWAERRHDKSDLNTVLQEGSSLDAVRRRLRVAELALDGMTIADPPFEPPNATTTEVRGQLREVVRGYITQRFRDGALPPLLITADASAGKTKEIIGSLPATIRADKALKRAHRVIYLLPRVRRGSAGHNLAAEIKKRIEQEDRYDDDGNERVPADWLKIEIFQGRTDGEEHELGNCDNMPAIWLAREAGAPPASTVCINGMEHCPVYDACQHGTGYYAQVARAAAADVVILAHNYLFEYLPEPITKRVSLVVIDEDPTGHGEETTEMLLSVLDFAERDTPVRSNDKPDDPKTIELEQLYQRIRRVLDAGNPTPKALAAEGLTRADLRKTRQLSWKRKIAHGMSPSMSLEDRRAAARKSAINIKLGAIDKLIDALEEIAPNEDSSPQLGLDDNAGRVQVEGGVITVYGHRKIRNWLKDLPTVILAARISPDRVRRFFPDLETPAMPRPAAPHQTIHQHLGGFGTHHLPEKIPDLIVEFRRIIAERSALIIAPKSVIPALRASLPTASFLHHGAVTGTDHYGKVEVVIVWVRSSPIRATSRGAPAPKPAWCSSPTASS